MGKLSAFDCHPCRDTTAPRMGHRLVGLGRLPAWILVARGTALGLRRRCRRESVAEHDLCHFCAVGRAAGGCVDDLGGFAEVLRADGSGRDDAEDFDVLAGVVVKAMDGSARNAEGLAGAYVNLPAVYGPGQDAFEAVDGFLVVVVAMRRGREPLRAGNDDLKGSDGAGRVLAGEQEANGERTDEDGFVGGIDLQVDGLGCDGNLLRRESGYGRAMPGEEAPARIWGKRRARGRSTPC